MTEKEDKDEIRRVEFVLNEDEMKFERSESKTLFDDLDTSPATIMENPINLLLSNFDNEYMKNERMGVILFEELNKAMRKYTRMVNENFYYQDMEIVQIFSDLVIRYNTWITNQRGLILNTREMVRQIRNMVETEYITNNALDRFKEEIKMQMNEEEKSFGKALVGNINGEKIIIIPKDSKIKEGDLVDFKKSK